MSARHRSLNPPTAPLCASDQVRATVWISPSPRKAANHPLALVRLARLSRA
ncbi:hypothetical protein PUR61_10535 [Streptomyces sp. BE20]|uniref:hypothetical protein n=1 Tax=Streptomycetaceae TaxID=2062 RepID=UPI002E7815FD|nr:MULTISPECIES: hypothetical protein [unclassified Streptomyces]MED7951481.1 hypothetical protein [Streptomyces sp. BE303]MEE1822624.1 hypothetical protein [Streptomyces sp. BE20]